MPLTVTCITKGCDNAGVTIDVDPTPPYVVACGPCGATIAEDLTGALEPTEPGA